MALLLLLGRWMLGIWFRFIFYFLFLLFLFLFLFRALMLELVEMGCRFTSSHSVGDVLVNFKSTNQPYMSPCGIRKLMLRGGLFYFISRGYFVFDPSPTLTQHQERTKSED